MGNEYRAKVFKSGNSVALRLPKGMGFSEGEDVVIAPHEDGSFSLWRESEGVQVLMSLYGSVSEGFMADGRGDTRADMRDWSPRPGAAAA